MKEQLKQQITGLGSDVALVHTDLLRGFEITSVNKTDLLAAHLREIEFITVGKRIWMPAFNYDFFKGEVFSVNESVSQVGGLTEYFRLNVAKWRTPVPVYSFVGTGEAPVLQTTGVIDPFGTQSAFDYLYKQNAVLIHYGSDLIATTFIHYAERISPHMNYRYDKLFTGTLRLSDGQQKSCELQVHVRPKGKHLAYDWDKIENDLLMNGILFKYTQGRTRILVCRVGDLVNFVLEKMKQDSLYMLDTESKQWAGPMLQKLGRAFTLTDFE